jgi:hypothetical protein
MPTPRREINWSRAPAIVWLTLVFWLFTFVVFQAPALRTGRITVWETTAYLAIVACGFVFSMGLYGLGRGLRDAAGRARLGAMLAAALVAAVVHSALDHQAFVISARIFRAANQLPALIDGFVFNILIYVWIYGLYVAPSNLRRRRPACAIRSGGWLPPRPPPRPPSSPPCVSRSIPTSCSTR